MPLRAAVLTLALLATTAGVIACGTVEKNSCSVDSQCLKGQSCQGGFCADLPGATDASTALDGAVAGPDASVDAGSPDVGSPDVGPVSVNAVVDFSKLQKNSPRGVAEFVTSATVYKGSGPVFCSTGTADGNCCYTPTLPAALDARSLDVGTITAFATNSTGGTGSAPLKYLTTGYERGALSFQPGNAIYFSVARSAELAALTTAKVDAPTDPVISSPLLGGTIDRGSIGVIWAPDRSAVAPDPEAVISISELSPAGDEGATVQCLIKEGGNATVANKLLLKLAPGQGLLRVQRSRTGYQVIGTYDSATVRVRSEYRIAVMIK